MCVNGFDNEYQFVMALNNKRVGELNILLKDLIYTIFNNITDDMIVKSWRNHYKQKSDVMIKIDKWIKGISIKVGTRNSVHATDINKFIKFLKDNNVSDNTIKNYLMYHYADGSLDNSGITRLSTKEYKKLHQNEIDEINIELNNEKLVKKAVETFVTLGTNSNYKIDALIYGSPTDFFFLLPSEIEDIIFDNKEYCTGPHFGKLVFQPMDRCLNRNPKYEYCRKIVQVRWYNILDDIIMYKNNKIVSTLDK